MKEGGELEFLIGKSNYIPLLLVNIYREKSRKKWKDKTLQISALDKYEGEGEDA